MAKTRGNRKAIPQGVSAASWCKQSGLCPARLLVLPAQLIWINAGGSRDHLGGLRSTADRDTPSPAGALRIRCDEFVIAIDDVGQQAALASNDKEEETMTFGKLCRTAVAGAALTMFGFGSAYAQDLDDLKICEAAAAAFQAVAANNQDADLESAKGEVAQGLADCKSGKTADGLATINLATAEISDGVQGSHKHKT